MLMQVVRVSPATRACTFDAVYFHISSCHSILTSRQHIYIFGFPLGSLLCGPSWSCPPVFFPMLPLWSPRVNFVLHNLPDPSAQNDPKRWSGRSMFKSVLFSPFVRAPQLCSQLKWAHGILPQLLPLPASQLAPCALPPSQPAKAKLLWALTVASNPLASIRVVHTKAHSTL